MLSIKNKFAFRIKVHKTEKHIISKPLNMFKEQQQKKHEKRAKTRGKKRSSETWPQENSGPKHSICAPAPHHWLSTQTFRHDGQTNYDSRYLIRIAQAIRKIYRTHFSNWSLLPLIFVSCNVKRFLPSIFGLTQAMSSLFFLLSFFLVLHNAIINIRAYGHGNGYKARVSSKNKNQ